MYKSESPICKLRLVVSVFALALNNWIIGRMMKSSGNTVIVPITKRLRR